MNMNYELVFPEYLLKDRIVVALNFLGINEFYNSFKYLKHIVAGVIANKDDSKEGIRNEISKVAKRYGNTDQTIMTGICKIYSKCNNKLLEESFPSNHTKANYLDKIRIVTKYVYNLINKESMF